MVYNQIEVHMVLTTISNDLSYASFSMILLLIEIAFVLFIRFKQPFKKPDFKYINQAILLVIYLFIPTAFYVFITFFNTLPIIKEYNSDIYIPSFFIFGGLFVFGIAFGLFWYALFWCKCKSMIDLESRTTEGHYSYYRGNKYKHINSFSLAALIISINLFTTLGCFILSLFAVNGYCF